MSASDCARWLGAPSPWPLLCAFFVVNGFVLSVWEYLWSCMSVGSFGEESVVVLEDARQAEVRWLMLGKRKATSRAWEI